MSNTEWEKGYEEGFAAGLKAAKEEENNKTEEKKEIKNLTDHTLIV